MFPVVIYFHPMQSLILPLWLISGMQQYISRVIRKPTFCICENKGADKLRSNCDLVGNPEDRLSRDAAHIHLNYLYHIEQIADE